jgi:hypothetical protein
MSYVMLAARLSGCRVIEQLIRVGIDAAGELDLLDHLVCGVVQLLFRRDDAKQVDYERKQNHRDKNENDCTEIVGFASIGFQHFAKFFQEESPPLQRAAAHHRG